jgi:hypothetical protein
MITDGQSESWLSFHHGAFNQNQLQGKPELSSLRKMIQISDLFRFISEFVFEGDEAERHTWWRPGRVRETRGQGDQGEG